MSISFDDLSSPKTFVPGVKAKHAIISTACREGHGDEDASAMALNRLETELRELLRNWPREKDATFHLILTVDREGRGDPNA